MAENENIEELKEEIISLEQSDDTASDVVSQEQEEEKNIEEADSATEEEKKDNKKEKRERKNILKSFWNIIKTIFMGRILSVDFIIRYWKTILTALFISLF